MWANRWREWVWENEMRAAGLESTRRVERLQYHLLRDIFSNLFRPVTLDPGWRTPKVRTLAKADYDQRELPAGTLDPGRMTVLADALEEAGCMEADLLDHLRGPGPHVRGCWAIDLLLEKA
jgi:hypothetical protein